VQINLKVDKDNVILVFSKGRLHALSSIDGEVLWEKDFSAERFKQLNFDDWLPFLQHRGSTDYSASWK
jgi:hypothetical protein